jgi:lysophospholipase L1-like esterase
MQFVIPMSNPCKKATINTSGFINKFTNGYNPGFNDEGTELDFYAKSSIEKPKAVSLTTSGYVVPRLDYLALGDSFTSGEGETDDSFYELGTNDEFEKCHLSTRSYPYIIARTLGIESQYVHSVACSGATTSDVMGEDSEYWGQQARLDKDALKLGDTSKTLYQQQSVDTFSPGRVHQIAFVKKYKPRIITIGIGGNDVGLMEKLRTCVGFDSCEWADTAEGREKTAFEIQDSFDKLVSTYTSIRDVSPLSRIYVIGYPKVIDQNGQCTFFDGILLDSTERQFMNEAVHYINQIISAAAQKTGLSYIDTEDSFGNKVLCGHTKPSVMNAIRAGDD